MNFELLPSDDGNDPLSPFPFHDKVVKAAVEIEMNKLLLAIEGKSSLYVIDVPTRLATKVVANPTKIAMPLSLIPAPGYDQNSNPWVFLKDSRYISAINTKDLKVIPLLRQTNEVDLRRNHFLFATRKEEGDSRNVILYNLDY